MGLILVLALVSVAATLLFPYWGLVVPVAGISVNPGALLGVLILSFVLASAFKRNRILLQTVGDAQRKLSEDADKGARAEEAQKELTQSLRRYQEAADAGRSLSGVLNKDQLLRRVLESVLKIAHCDIGYLVLFDYNTNEFSYEIGMGMDTTMLTLSRYPANDPVIKRIMDKQRIISFPFSRQVQQAEYFTIKPEKLDRFKSVTWIFTVPLVIENNMLGIITLYANEEAANLINAEGTLFSLVVNQAAIALGSAIQCEYAVLDRLTLVFNHEYFQRRLMEELSRCRRYKLKMALVMLDIDHFKGFNDTYGHQVGDDVLKTVSQILKKSLRVVDLCARYGGEEFAVILPETPLIAENLQLTQEEMQDPEKVGGAVLKAERIREAIEKHPFEVKGKRVPITVSLGVTGWALPDDKDIEKEALVKRADDELYAAKKNGRNRVCWMHAGKEKKE